MSVPNPATTKRWKKTKTVYGGSSLRELEHEINGKMDKIQHAGGEVIDIKYSCASDSVAIKGSSYGHEICDVEHYALIFYEFDKEV